MNDGGKINQLLHGKLNILILWHAWDYATRDFRVILVENSRCRITHGNVISFDADVLLIAIIFVITKEECERHRFCT
jgi:hypothetical protein